MDIKREFLTVCQLLGLLCLLFWSFTWNLPENFDFFEPRKHLQAFPKRSLKETHLNTKLLSNEEKPPIIFESFGKSEKRLPTSTYSMLPPFNIWKEIELTKQEEKEVQRKVPSKEAKPLRRKLNYASAKCGAKILAANKEAKYRAAILNEKIDEYMLNPCKAKSWFIVELCDNIEATQIELANYELYSSTPRKFSVFWSDVYPTQAWRYLGTFEAKDQRTVQTFELKTQNMGKFVKVLVLNHHGREHYCPLSVFRILGYSMVYEYQDIELEYEKIRFQANETSNAGKEVNSKVHEKEVNSDNGNSIFQGFQNKGGLMKHKMNYLSNSIQKRFCELNQKYCVFTKGRMYKNTCSYQLSCIFLKIITANTQDMYICDNICSRNTATKSNGHFSIDLESVNRKEKLKYSKFDLRSKVKSNNPNIRETKVKHYSPFVLSNLFRGKEHLLFIYSNQFQFLNRSPMKSKPVKEKSSKQDKYKTLDKSDITVPLTRLKFDDIRTTNLKHKLLQPNENTMQNPDLSNFKYSCDCQKSEATSMRKKYFPDTSLEFAPVGIQEQEKSTESAALIQKESVLVKLTNRIKASETNLTLINRYLQKLSQSYKHQMEDMQNMFNVTLNAVRLASEEANTIDEQQHFAINQLEHQVKALNYRTQYLSHSQGNIFKKVLELHGFFLILEFIIMSTAFSIFVNRLRLNKFEIKR